MMFLATLAVAGLRTLSDGWAVFTLWAWFISPLGAPDISFWHACGLDLFVGSFLAFAAPKPTQDVPDAEVLAYSAGKVLIAPVLVGMGWLIQLGMA